MKKKKQSAKDFFTKEILEQFVANGWDVSYTEEGGLKVKTR